MFNLVKDAEQLASVGRLFQLLSKQSKIKNTFVKLMYMFDDHPKHDERARMFLEARDQIAQLPEAE